MPREVFLSPAARVVYSPLEHAPGTADELAKEGKLPVAIIEYAFTELRHAGLAAELEPGSPRRPLRAQAPHLA